MSTPERLSTKSVVVIGVGAVGSQVAVGLAHEGIGRLCLIDHDDLEEGNLHRHVLGRADLGKNKAVATKLFLDQEIKRGLRTEAVDRKVDDSFPDAELDQLLRGADLIVAATDEREAQRRIFRRSFRGFTRERAVRFSYSEARVIHVSSAGTEAGREDERCAVSLLPTPIFWRLFN